jgi:cytoskeletal protein CcmA (bactofilin family)
MFNKPKSSQPSDESPAPARVAPERPTASSGLSGLVSDSSAKPSVISTEVELRGDLVSDGVIHIDGRVFGNVSCQSVNIAENGSVEGQVRCSTFQIKGRFTGSAICDHVGISATARVKAELVYKSLTVAPGAVLQGDVRLEGDPSPARSS